MRLVGCECSLVELTGDHESLPSWFDLAIASSLEPPSDENGQIEFWSANPASRDLTYIGNVFDTKDLRWWRNRLAWIAFRADMNLSSRLIVQASPPPRFSSSAASRHSINVCPAKGLAKKPIAPALRAEARRRSLGKAVMKMNGTP